MAVAESGVATPADAAAMRRLGYGVALIGTALMTRDDPRRCSRKFCRRHGQCRDKWLHSAPCESRLRDYHCRRHGRRRGRAGGRDPPRVCAEPEASHPREAAQLAALAPAGNLRSPSLSIRCRGGRDLPHPQAGLFSDQRRGFERTQNSAAHQGAACRALRPRDAESAACAHVLEGRAAASASWPIGAAPLSSPGRPKSFWQAACPRRMWPRRSRR